MKKVFLAAFTAIAFAGCAQLPAPLQPSPYIFWRGSGPDGQWISQVFDNGTDTYILPRPHTVILSIASIDKGGTAQADTVMADGAYYTISGVHDLLRITLVGGTVLDWRNPRALPEDHAPKTVEPTKTNGQHSAAVLPPRTKALGLAGPVTTAAMVMPEKAPTIGELFVASKAPIDARVASGILSMHMRDLIALLPNNWYVVQGAGVHLGGGVSVYLSQTAPEALKSACGQIHTTCVIDASSDTLSMEMPK